MIKSNDKNNKKLEEFFLKAFDDYSESILRHIYFRVNAKSLAEDLTSETFMKTWQYLREGKEVKNIKSFLYRVSNNLVIDYYRSKSKQNVSIEDVAEPMEPNAQNLEEDFDVKKLSDEIINKHLDALPQEHKQIIIYRYIDELDIGEIKELTGKSTTNIYTIIHRALKRLKEALSKNGETN